MSQDNPVWGASENRPKVAWGSGAQPEARPARRAGAPTPPSYGADLAPVAPAQASTATAQLHGGAMERAAGEVDLTDLFADPAPAGVQGPGLGESGRPEAGVQQEQPLDPWSILDAPAPLADDVHDSPAFEDPAQGDGGELEGPALEGLLFDEGVAASDTGPQEMEPAPLESGDTDPAEVETAESKDSGSDADPVDVDDWAAMFALEEVPAEPSAPEQQEVVAAAPEEVASSNGADSSHEPEVAPAAEALAQPLPAVVAQAPEIVEAPAAQAPSFEMALVPTQVLEPEPVLVSGPGQELGPVDESHAAAAVQPFSDASVAISQAEVAPNAPASRFDLAGRLAQLSQARQAPPAPTSALDTRYLRQDHYYDIVDRILGIGAGAGNPRLVSILRRIELTRDPRVDAEQRAAYQDALEPLLHSHGVRIPNPTDKQPIFDIAYDEVVGIGPLGPLWRDDSVTEIMVSGPDRVTVERNGRLEVTPVRFRDLTHLETTARTLAGKSEDDRAVSATSPLVTIQLHRARVQFVWRPLSVAKVSIAIRKFGALMDMNQLLRFGSLSEEMAAFLCDATRARGTILVSGGTGSGKTTFINAVSEFIPDTERVITIEDALELQLRNTHVESFVTKEAASADDRMLWGQDALLKASLRMRPDRIIVGEIRDGKGASVMLEAANTGHEGTMTTIHASSGERALDRLGLLLRRAEGMPDDVARREVHSAIDLVVQVVRKRGRRFVSEISLVTDDPHSPTVPLFVGDFPADAVAPTFRRVGSLRPDTDLAQKISDAGLSSTDWE